MHVPDPLDWIAGKRSWKQFLRYAERLARIPGSAYREALELNPELAGKRKKLPKAKNPPLFGYSAEMYLITDLADLLYKRFARDPGVSFPRPLTAVDHLSLAKRQAGMDRLIRSFFPDHTHLTPNLKA